MSEQALVFLDTETDGLRSSRRVWEVALIRVSPGDEDSVIRSFFVEGIEPHRAERGALEVGGYYDRHPHGRQLLAPPPTTVKPSAIAERPLTQAQAAQEVFRLTRGATLVGVNPAFDAHALERLLYGQGLAPEWDYRLIDVACLALGTLYAQGEDISLPWSSYQLSRWTGVEPPEERNRHTALGDAEWAMRWFLRLAGGEDAS